MCGLCCGKPGAGNNWKRKPMGDGSMNGKEGPNGRTKVTSLSLMHWKLVHPDSSASSGGPAAPAALHFSSAFFPMVLGPPVAIGFLPSSLRTTALKPMSAHPVAPQAPYPLPEGIPSGPWRTGHCRVGERDWATLLQGTWSTAVYRWHLGGHPDQGPASPPLGSSVGLQNFT